MIDIFISYKSSDRERIQALVKALEQKGWSVWWDRTIPPGKIFDEVIEEALNAAKCVIVVWSKDSVLSEWVKDEADIGKRRGILIPVLIDDVEIPLGFGRIQAASLVDWVGTLPHMGFEQLSEAVESVLSHSPESIHGQGAEGKKGEGAKRLEQERQGFETHEKTSREETERKARERAGREEVERKAGEEQLKGKADNKVKGTSRWVYWAVGGLIVLTLLIGVKWCGSPPSQPPYAPIQLYCCDSWGNRRCSMTVPVPLGSPCTCPYQGGGVVCQ